MSRVDWRGLAIYGVAPALLTLAVLYAVGSSGAVPVEAGTLFLLASLVMAPVTLVTGQSNGDWKVEAARESQHEGTDLRGENVDPPELSDGPISGARGPLVQRVFYYSITTFVLSVVGLVVVAVTYGG